ncbi:GNAT family N-acetyltransferase [Paenibacillus antri]|uniref:GNAT family N-acetyltransferase n=1 Tax=Paenibacillus antri TaxID=2582848 RepID=A0A5R9G749_9BACL|nr:GNAT family N-acetyltransferase [Paenibacillus antri]TLS52227.1 GNAT family N-acetyltransferase [Paenibacillus antri]
MSGDVVVRQADLADVEDAAVLFDEYRQFYRQSSDLAGAVAYLTERLERKESSIFLASDAKSGRILGFTQLYPSFSSISMKRVWILNDLFVTAEHRGRGAAQRLLERAKAHAAETGAKGLALSTAVDNAVAQRLYERNGYVRETEFIDYFLSI